MRMNEDLMRFIQETICLKIKDKAYVIILDEYADVGTPWIALFCNSNEIVYFDSFGIEHVPEEVEKFIGHKTFKLTFFEYKQTI